VVDISFSCACWTVFSSPKTTAIFAGESIASISALFTNGEAKLLKIVLKHITIDTEKRISNGAVAKSDTCIFLVSSFINLGTTM
jgi:hypothetical protein